MAPALLAPCGVCSGRPAACVRKPADVATPLVFFAIVVSLFPLGVGPEPAVLRTLAPGVLWVAALLATMLSLSRLFAAIMRMARSNSWP